MTTWIEIYARCISPLYGEDEARKIIELNDDKTIKLILKYNEIYGKGLNTNLATCNYPKLIMGSILSYKGIKKYKNYMNDFISLSQNFTSTDNLNILISLHYTISTDLQLLEMRKISIKNTKDNISFLYLENIFYTICRYTEYYEFLNFLGNIYPEYQMYINLLQQKLFVSGDSEMPYVKYFLYFLFLESLLKKYEKDSYFDPYLIDLIGQYLEN